VSADGRLLVLGALAGLAAASATRGGGSRGAVRAARVLKKRVPPAQPGERPSEKDLDEHAVHDLVITTVSDGDLYPTAQNIAKMLAKHLVKDRFDRTAGAKAFEQLADSGARKIGWDQYERPRATHWSKQKLPSYYPASVRRAASWDLLDHYTELIESYANGEHGPLHPPRAKRGSGGVVRAGKRSSESEQYGDEVVLYLSNQNRLACNAYPADLAYLRVTDLRGRELLHRRIPEDLESDPGKTSGPREVAAQMLEAIVAACGVEARADREYGRESAIGLAGHGWICVFGEVDAAPLDYIRVVNAQGVEEGFWSIDEIVDTPAEVLGALMGAARNLQP